MLQFLSDHFYYPTVALLLGVLLMRRAERKRMALLLWSLLALGLWGVTVLLLRYGLPGWLLLAAIAAEALIVLQRRDLFFAWRRTCVRCDRALDLRSWLSEDSDCCASCRSAQYPRPPDAR